MSKNLIRKLVSSLFFLLSLYLIQRIYSEISENISNKEISFLFAALFLSIVLLFILVFTFQTEIIYKKEKKTNEKKKNTGNEQVEVKISKTKNKINAMLSEIKKVTSEEKFSENILKLFSKHFFIVQGIVYKKNNEDFQVDASYAVYEPNKIKSFKEGQGISGQVVKNKKIKIISDIPEDYIPVVSGLGAASPDNLILIPVIAENQTVALIEASAFGEFPKDFEQFYNPLNKVLVDKIKNDNED